MIDGDVGNPLLEVLHRIAAILHGGSHETVGFFERAVGVIDESRLHGPPILGVALPCLCRERPDLELRSPLLASPQLALRLAPIVEHPDGPVVLRSETFLQRSRPLTLDHHPDQPRDDQDPDRDQDPHPCVHDGSPSSRAVRSGSPGSYPFAARHQTCRCGAENHEMLRLDDIVCTGAKKIQRSPQRSADREKTRTDTAVRRAAIWNAVTAKATARLPNTSVGRGTGAASSSRCAPAARSTITLNPANIVLSGTSSPIVPTAMNDS